MDTRDLTLDTRYLDIRAGKAIPVSDAAIPGVGIAATRADRSVDSQDGGSHWLSGWLPVDAYATGYS